MLSNTSRYAIRAVIYLALNAEDNHKIGIKEISKELDIPSPFLGKILQLLAKQKILSSTKGPNGGFGLGRNADEITLFDVIKIIDGDDIFTKCLISLRTCSEENIPCPLHSQYEKIRADISNMFKNQTIADLAHNIKKSRKNIII